MDHERVILAIIYISISQTLSVMIFNNDFFLCSGIMVKINHQLREDSVLTVPSGEEKIMRRPQSTFQYLQVPTRKSERTLCIRNCSQRRMSNGYKWQEEKFEIEIGKNFYCGGGKTLEEVALGHGGCPSLAVFRARVDEPLSNLV